MAWVYILKSRMNDRLYIGCTEDLEDRLRRHNGGYEQATKPYRPYDVVFRQEYSSLQEARSAEARLKKWKRKDFLEKVISNGLIK